MAPAWTRLLADLQGNTGSFGPENPPVARFTVSTGKVNQNGAQVTGGDEVPKGPLFMNVRSFFVTRLSRVQRRERARRPAEEADETVSKNRQNP